jgi:hypothetical protein
MVYQYSLDSSSTHQRLRELAEGKSLIINGTVWTREGNEFKVSPRGLLNDFETGSYRVARKALRETLTTELNAVSTFN